MMQVRVRQNARWNNLMACAGREFVKFEYRPVPAQFEAEAARNPDLEVLQEAGENMPQEVQALEIPQAETPIKAKRGKKQ